MEAVAPHVQAFLAATPGDAAAEAALAATVQAVEAGQASLINVVEALGSALTHSDAAVRARGVELLAGVAAKTPVPPRQAPNLIQFFVSRLHDHASVPGLLDGLAAILRAPGIGKSHAVAIPVQVLDSLNVQSYNQPVRHRVLSILRHAVDSFGPELAKQPEFVPGFVTALEGEKDPRNLLLGFGLARDIIERFDIEPYAEDMFEMLFSYFPITFRPPPDDVIGITAEDLKEALKSCLKATAFFAPFAMPALVEKLGTSSGAAKRDAVETISACAPVYGINAVAPHIDNIWELLKDDVEKAQEDSTEQKNALFCVRSILTTLSNSAVSAHNNPLEGMLKMVVGDCISHLKEPESKLARTSGRLVVASAAASDAAFSYAIQTAVPRLLELISTEREPKKRKLYLEILGDTIAAGTPLYAKKDGDDGELTNPLSVYVPDIAQILARVLQEDRDHGAAAVPAVRAACALIESGLLNADAKSGLYSMLHEAMLGSADGKVREEALSAIVKLSAGDAALAAQRTFPLLLESLKNEENLDWPLQCLKEMTLHHPSGAADILKTLVSQLALAREKMDAGGDAAEESDLLLSTLSSIVSGLDSLPSLASLVLFPLWSLCILSALSPSARFAQGALPAVSNITTTVTRSLSASFQSQLLIPTFQIFVGGDASSLGLTLPSSPVSHSSPAQITILSVLFASVLIATRREAELPIPAADLVAKLFSEASQAGSPVLAVSLAKGAASLVNKLCEVAGVKEVAERVSNDAIARIRDPSCSEADKRKHVIILIWITRATVLRSLASNVEQLVSLLSDPAVGSQVADAFGLVISERELALSKLNHAVIRPLYKQKLVSGALPLILSSCRQATPATTQTANVKAAHLIALSNLLSDAPPAILSQNLDAVLPFLLESLDVDNAGLKQLATGFIASIASGATAKMIPHTTSALDRLLRLLQPSSSNTATVRIAALKTLSALAQKIPYDQLHPSKIRVTRALEAASDDSVKSVRKEAGVARARWLGLSS